MTSPQEPGEGGPSQFGRVFRDAGPLFGSGIQMAAAIVLMFFVGRWLDERWETAPWLMFVGTALGAAAGLVQFIRTVNQQTSREQRPGGSGS